MERNASGPGTVAIAQGMRAYGLFRGAAPGAAVAREDLLGPGLHLARPLVRHRLMVDGLVVINNGVACMGLLLMRPSIGIIICNIAIWELIMRTA